MGLRRDSNVGHGSRGVLSQTGPGTEGSYLPHRLEGIPGVAVNLFLVVTVDPPISDHAYDQEREIHGGRLLHDPDFHPPVCRANRRVRISDEMVLPVDLPADAGVPASICFENAPAVCADR